MPAAQSLSGRVHLRLSQGKLCNILVMHQVPRADPPQSQCCEAMI